MQGTEPSLLIFPALREKHLDRWAAQRVTVIQNREGGEQRFTPMYGVRASGMTTS
jgi:hypothetical protein